MNLVEFVAFWCFDAVFRYLHHFWAFGLVLVLTVDGLGRAFGSAPACGRSDGLFGNSTFGVLRPGRAQHGSARVVVHTGV